MMKNKYIMAFVLMCSTSLSVNAETLTSALEKAYEYYNKCKNSILGLKNNEFLLSFVEYIYSRKN